MKAFHEPDERTLILVRDIYKFEISVVLKGPFGLNLCY